VAAVSFPNQNAWKMLSKLFSKEAVKFFRDTLRLNGNSFSPNLEHHKDFQYIAVCGRCHGCFGKQKSTYHSVECTAISHINFRVVAPVFTKDL
jgi:hypothetical protein